MIAAVSEKDFHTSVKNTSNSGDAQDSPIEWTDEEERLLVRKIDTAIMPLLTLGFYALQLDRGNIGNALTDFFLRDVGITQNQFNVGQQLLPLGIIILEMPSNLVLYRIGPVLWLGGQMMAWGLIATFLLGLGEAGFIPGSLYTITRWYKRNETSKRFSIFFLGNMLASATSGLIAFGILRMRGIAGLSGWQWLFILEGVFTVVVGVTFLSFFPKSPSKPTSLFAFGWFTERERQIMVARILRDDPSKSQSRPSISWQETKQAASQALSKFYGTSAKLESNALISISYWMLLFSILFWGWAADRTRIRGLWVILGLVIFWALNIGSWSLAASHDKAARFACWLAYYILDNFHGAKVQENFAETDGFVVPMKYDKAIDALVVAALSQATSWANANRPWQERIEQGGIEQLQNALRPGGMQNRKSKLLTTLLRDVKARYVK
ncbi:putative transporter like protein [Verticillium longisporum]|nr:putative transporter like protein [Verticillium longisporum]